MAGTQPPIRTHDQLFAHYLLLSNAEQEAFGQLFVDLILSNSTSPLRRNITAAALKAVEPLAARLAATERDLDCAREKAATAEGILQEFAANRQKKRGQDPKRARIAQELEQLKKVMIWRKLTKFVMDEHPEWVEATWPKGTKRTPEAVKSVYEYLRKILRDRLARRKPV